MWRVLWRRRDFDASAPSARRARRSPIPIQRQVSSDDRGQVGGIEALPFGLLVFVVGALLVANTWAVVDASVSLVECCKPIPSSHWLRAGVGLRTTAFAGRSV